MGGNWVCRQH